MVNSVFVCEDSLLPLLNVDWSALCMHLWSHVKGNNTK